MGDNYEADKKYITVQTGTAMKKVLKFFPKFVKLSVGSGYGSASKREVVSGSK
jgi:hypothetical protein